MLFTDGATDLDQRDRDELARNGIRHYDAPLARFEGEGGRLRRVRFADGDCIEREAVFFSMPTRQRPSSLLPASAASSTTAVR